MSTALNNERNPNLVQVYLGNQGSAAAVVVPGIFFRKRSRLKNVYVVDQLGNSSSTTDYFTFSLQDNSPTPIAYASFTSSGLALAAVTQSPPFALLAGGGQAFDAAPGLDADSATQPETDIPASTMLNLKITGVHSAGNKVLTNAVMVLEYYPL